MGQIKRQAGCIPVREVDGEVQVLLVTSRYTGEWISPKGGISPGETPREAAARECREEAGVMGDILGRLGKYEYARGDGIGRVDTYILRVSRQMERWQEESERRRRWFSLDAAQKEVHRAGVLEMLRCLRKALHTKKFILTE